MGVVNINSLLLGDSCLNVFELHILNYSACLEMCCIRNQNGKNICSDLYDPAHINRKLCWPRSRAPLQSLLEIVCLSVQPVISHPSCVAGCEDISSPDPRRAGKGAEPVPGPVLHLSPQPQWDHPQWVHGPSQTGTTWQRLYYERVHFRKVQYLHRIWVNRVWTLIICAVCSEKSPGHSLGRGAERTGAADDERGSQSKPGLATQLPYSQHVQWGPRSHLHQRSRCEILAGQRSVVILSVFITETRKSSVDPDCLCISPLTLFISSPLSCLFRFNA